MNPAEAPAHAHPCPEWLAARLRQAGGAVGFGQYMAWALHDPVHGAYGSGQLRVGPQGDFATSPSLGPDFAALLAPQIAQWLQQLEPQGGQPLALLEAGPGEGDLAHDLALELVTHWPQLAARVELVLIEPNAGMAARQRQRLQACPLPVRWSSFAALAAAPLRGVLLAHEVLDALPVERVIWDGNHWCRQLVRLVPTAAAEPSLLLAAGEPLDPCRDGSLWKLLQQRDLWAPAPHLPKGWTTELHTALEPWLAEAAAAIASGTLLVIDYALEGQRYNAATRSAGTLLAYRGQTASTDVLRQPGHWDLTAHLCIPSLDAAAKAAGWSAAGHCRQGQALLALGLAQRLHALQQLPAGTLAQALASREALLRLVDPAALGEFRWFAYRRGVEAPGVGDLFLNDGPLS
ncbi:MAG: SAM-dependent methyltransferase [Cyanobacteriota bacterium]|nr:SAM-dependent methyltransferase [Cyanobacteriota bacterium]